MENSSIDVNTTLPHLPPEKSVGRLRMGQWTCSKLGKESVKAIYCHSAYLIHVQSTSCEIQAG